MNKKYYLVSVIPVIAGIILLFFVQRRNKKNSEILNNYFNRYTSEFVPKNLFEQDLDPSPINRHKYIPVCKSYKNITNYPHIHNLSKQFKGGK